MAESRIANVERDVGELRKDMRELKRHIAEIREKLFNGVLKTVEEIDKILPTLATKADLKRSPTGKKPKRWEILFVLVAALTILNVVGLIEPIGKAFRLWIAGEG